MTVGVLSAIAAAAFGLGGRADAAGWPAAERALSHIKTATGQSALARLHSCGIKIDTRRSTLRPFEGGMVVYAPVTIPNGPGDDFHLVSIGWMLKAGTATPTSTWAEKLQFKAAPLGNNTWLRC